MRLNNKQSETNYIDIAQYIAAQESRIKEALNFHVDYALMKKECEAIIDGTVNYLWRNGFGEQEIDVLLRDMMKMGNRKEVLRTWSS